MDGFMFLIIRTASAETFHDFQGGTYFVSILVCCETCNTIIKRRMIVVHTDRLSFFDRGEGNIGVGTYQ